MSERLQHGRELERAQMTALDEAVDALGAFIDAKSERRKEDAAREAERFKRSFTMVIAIVINRTDHRTAGYLVDFHHSLTELRDRFNHVADESIDDPTGTDAGAHPDG